MKLTDKLKSLMNRSNKLPPKAMRMHGSQSFGEHGCEPSCQAVTAMEAEPPKDSTATCCYVMRRVWNLTSVRRCWVHTKRTADDAVVKEQLHDGAIHHKVQRGRHRPNNNGRRGCGGVEAAVAAVHSYSRQSILRHEST